MSDEQKQKEAELLLDALEKKLKERVGNVIFRWVGSALVGLGLYLLLLYTKTKGH